MSGPVLRCQDLRAQRGSFTLSIPSWEVPAGAVVGVLGPNGAGKTTLLRLLGGLEEERTGTVSVLGQDPARHPQVRSRVGIMSADAPVFDLRLDALLRFLSGYYDTWDDDYVQTLVARFGLDLGARPHTLSKGRGTALRLVTALAFKPTLLILDEPTTGLDLAARDALRATILEVVADPSRSVILATHELDEIGRLADRLLVLDGGQVTREGPIEDLLPEGRTLTEEARGWSGVEVRA